MLLVLAFGALGLIIGSFLNVVVLRHGARSLGGRSVCFSCGREIAWYDNIPVISWVTLGGRCRSCGARISLQYPLVEIVTAIVFAIIGNEAARLFPWEVSSLLLIVLSLAAASTLIAIAVYDTLHTIIPNAWAYVFGLFALGIALLSTPSELLNIPLLLIAGPVAATPLFFLWLISRGAWMGLGDAKLALGIGWLLGPWWGFIAVFLAFIIGAIVSVCILLPMPHIVALFQRTGIARLRGAAARFTMKSEVPFGPFLIASCFIVWFTQLNGISIPLLSWL